MLKQFWQSPFSPNPSLGFAKKLHSFIVCIAIPQLKQVWLLSQIILHEAHFIGSKFCIIYSEKELLAFVFFATGIKQRIEKQFVCKS